MAKRQYTQRLRAQAAEDNRQRILDTLYERLREAPAEPISIDEVARRAGVARSTIYLVFGSRSGLFDALTSHLMSGPGYQRIIEAVRLSDPRESMRGALAGGVQMYAGHHEVLRILYAMAKLDPEGVGQAFARSDDERSRGIARVARRLREAGALRPGVSAKQAATVLWLLAGFDAYDTLAGGRGLSAAQVSDVLIETAESALF